MGQLRYAGVEELYMISYYCHFVYDTLFDWQPVELVWQWLNMICLTA